ncbi:ABC transporter, partial [Patescibacteria group bacterium]|nr:ABC transporter [Patescibacteria group bacterium]
KVLFLDEPTIGLDVIAQKKMRDFIKHYNEERRTTIILTSHYMEDIGALCKRVIIINLGKIIYDGPIASLIEKYAPYKVLKITFEKEVKKSDLEKFGKVSVFNGDVFNIEVPRKESARIAAEILNKFPVDDILIDEPEIRDIIRLIFGKGKV